MKSIHVGLVLLAAFALLCAACAHVRGGDEAVRWQQSRQMIMVIAPDWNADHGTLRRFERDASGWQQVGDAQPVMLGRSGSAWGLGLHDPRTDGPIKHEGDGRSPAGVFEIGEAFGYAPTADTTLPYTPMQASSYCVDVSGSPSYNRIVDADVVGAAAIAGATEPMRRDLHADGDQRYREGFVIEHNPQQIAMGGSCIFAHLWKSPTDSTAGCTAMTPPVMQSLLAWLRPEDQPIFILLPQREYERLRTDWQLPAIAATGAAR